MTLGRLQDRELCDADADSDYRRDEDGEGDSDWESYPKESTQTGHGKKQPRGNLREALERA